MSVRASLALALALGCEAQQLSIGAGPPLQQGDVEHVPAGEAMGTDATGAYLFTAFSVERCECREGDPASFGCELVWELQADGLWLDQDAGELSATLIRAGRLDPAFVLRGGVEPDGAFEMGAAFDVVDFDAAVGTGYNLASGVLVARDSIDMRWIIRAQFVQGSEAFDCDLESDMSLAWWQAEIPAGGGESGDDGGESGDDGGESGDDGGSGAGIEGDPCGDPLDCDPAHVCVEGTCFDGTEGDPCTSPVDCAFESRHCIDGACWDGSVGDPCETEVDCDLAAGLGCGPRNTCE